MADRDAVRDGAGAALAVLVTMAAAALLVVVRGVVDQAVVALALAAVVCGCGLLGGWRAGVAGALTAAVSFNFFHTRPYLSLRIHDADDVLTTATLLLVGLMAGLAAHVVTRRGAAIEEAGAELAAVDRVIRVMAADGEADDVELAVRAELLGVLRLSGCHVADDAPAGVPVLQPSGAVDDAVLMYHDGGFELPGAGVVIPVMARGRLFGHLVCAPTPGTVVSLARRRTAASLAALLGIARSATHPAAG